MRFFFPNCWVRVHWMLVAFDESKNESKIMYTMKTRVIILVISGWFLVHSCRVASTYICFRLCFACGNNMMERLARTYKKRSDLEYMGSRATLENCAKTAHGKWKPHFVSSLFLPSDVWSFCRLPIVTRPCWIATSGAVHWVIQFLNEEANPWNNLNHLGIDNTSDPLCRRKSVHTAWLNTHHQKF